MSIETPSLKKAKLKKRLDKALKGLPDKWISLFVFKYPKYKDEKNHLSNVGLGKSLDESVIEKMETLAASIAPDKK